ncbi:type III-B CRISPR module RAMP protein Cmr6 [Paenibacillus sp. 1001270B_150601_E10]|uniref:type III-B CRISPR module RAMP protein Cmr6 n=1 Tax=Paenibacillus sp. 1001270B_150601_E10 TaxID=2787079 RepID=UPI00189FCD1C|nr:type III-B CRISPR module RAMP protein Cmr6 [Paenibacillus sp. 1001270B_150601_E10]
MGAEHSAGGMNAFLELTKLNDDYRKRGVLKAFLEGAGDGKRSFYIQLIEKYRKEWTLVPEWYSQRMKRYETSLTHSSYTRFIVQNQSALVMGQGQSSILETHVTLHRIYGVPYLPGTAIKGVTAHYCHRYVGEEHVEFRIGGKYYNLLFGCEDQASRIHYHDAFPTEDTIGQALVLDVMTPHHHEYNLNGESMKPPRDDDSPVPIPFLSVRADFQVLLSCESVNEDSVALLGLAQKLVVAAMEHEGIGGKINAGYGRFKKAAEL